MSDRSPGTPATPATRADWVAMVERLARPVLESAAEGRLEAALDVEHHPSCHPGRLRVIALEAMGRLLAGLGPWFDATLPDGSEKTLRDELAALARSALVIQSDPAHDAYLRFAGEERQTLVDAAFLAEGLYRGRASLWEPLDSATKARLHAGFIALRNRKPGFNNWLLFSAMTEAFLYATGGAGDPMRIDYALRQHEQWYLGDGMYGDGPEFHADYYNSYVIHPMLTDVLDAVRGRDAEWDRLRDERQLHRLARAAEIQERMIAPDGSWPVLGRSICYRCGAFQTLAQAALLRLLPPSLDPAQVRCALAAAIGRTLGRAESWRDDGFLRIGLAGHQPSLGEPYITTGSLYLAAFVFLPLGLPPADPFWSAPDAPWTSVRAFDLEHDIAADHAYREG